MDIKTKNNINKNIPEFLKQSNGGEATEKDKVKDGEEAKAENREEAEAKAKDGRGKAVKKEVKGLNKAKDIIRVSKVKKKGLLLIKFNLNKVFNIAYIIKI